MNHLTRIPTHSLSHDFFIHGQEGLGLNRAMERRIAERERDRIIAALRASNRPSLVRRWLGGTMIALGTGIAGRKNLAPRAEDLLPGRLKLQ